jgi:hypothetical protein
MKVINAPITKVDLLFNSIKVYFKNHCFRGLFGAALILK